MKFMSTCFPNSMEKDRVKWHDPFMFERQIIRIHRDNGVKNRGNISHESESTPHPIYSACFSTAFSIASTILPVSLANCFSSAFAFEA